jgi:hypothetical protein
LYFADEARQTAGRKLKFPIIPNIAGFFQNGKFSVIAAELLGGHEKVKQGYQRRMAANLPSMFENA